MKKEISHLLQDALQELFKNQLISNIKLTPQLQATKDPKHGDFASNIALQSAKYSSLSTKDLAIAIRDKIPANSLIDKITIAGPGFINFYLKKEIDNQYISNILEQGINFGKNTITMPKKIHLEYISANPTGPLHVGHGRSAVYGSVVATLLKHIGHHVQTEYYINDAGRQMDILATSIWLRYLESQGLSLPFPVNGYKGDYIKEIAQTLFAQYNTQLFIPLDTLQQGLPEDASPNGEGDKEIYIDALIAKAKLLLGPDYQKIAKLGIQSILDDIKLDLKEFGVTFDNWFSERKLIRSNILTSSIARLKERKTTYIKEEALWFKATAFGDDKDRVLIRKNGNPTYFASDVAYHCHKIETGADIIIDILGADHHGYIARLKALLEASGYDPNKLKVLLVQFATLYRGKEKIQMSTRSGSFITLRELRNEIGRDATRFFYILRKSDQHLDFDLELAKSKTNENPLYYIQYAYARICSIENELNQRKIIFDEALGLKHIKQLISVHEIMLLKHLRQYLEILKKAALNYEPHRLAIYLKELAHYFHSYYNAQPFLTESNTQLRNARLCLLTATKQILLNGLHLMGVKAPKHM